MERLAVDGGRPVRSTLLPYGRQAIDDDDVRAVVGVLQSDWLTTGPAVGAYEADVCAAVGARHAVAFSSGTAALHAAVHAAGIGPGDEVITSPLTFVASANCARFVGADPVFADVRDDTLTIDPGRVAAAIGPRTRALIPVDFAGQPADLDELTALAARHGLTVIEDAAHSLGASYRGRRVGTLATLTVFSTHPVKHVTTGEGGVVATDDARLADRLRLFRNHGISSDARARQEAGSWYYEMVELGYNYRITDLQCALGSSQLRKLPRWVERRQEIAARYSAELAGLEPLRLPLVAGDRTSSWHLYVVRVRRGALRGDVGRDAVFKALRAENIGVNVHYIPVTWHPYYQQLGHRRGAHPVAESAYEELITLPLFPAMSDADVGDVVTAVRKVVTAYAHPAGAVSAR
ncbi:MAG: UDP-4-amino-4,6-dideoxy-N-acetyl-beta-L-altrosamine transaminase [Vicinamibacterales bacterium]